MRTLPLALLVSALASPALHAQGDWTRIEDESALVPSLDMSVGELGGLPVMTETGERVGDIADVLIEPGTDVLAVTLDVGSFLGLSAKDVLVPLEDVTLFDGDLVTALTRDEFARMPDYAPDSTR